MFTKNGDDKIKCEIGCDFKRLATVDGEQIKNPNDK